MPRHWLARDERIARLRRKRRLTEQEHRELARLERLRDALWHQLPRRIAARRHDLDRLTAYADHIGLGPC